MTSKMSDSIQPHMPVQCHPSSPFYKRQSAYRMVMGEFLMNIKARLQAVMDERGWTIYKVAKEAGLPWSTVRNMFKRNTEPSITTLESICSGMGITLAQFFHSGCSENLSDAQRKLVMKWNTLNEHDQNLILDLVDSLNEK